jgi:hypothetical protein
VNNFLGLTSAFLEADRIYPGNRPNQTPFGYFVLFLLTTGVSDELETQETPHKVGPQRLISICTAAAEWLPNASFISNQTV